MTQRYVCSLPNPGVEGFPRECFYTDDEEGRARAEQFAKQENRPGRGVYDCIGILKDGVSARNKDNVAELDKVVVDLDLKNIVEPREEVIAKLNGLALPPSEIRDSGFGLHAAWHLKEPVTDDAGLKQAEDIMSGLVGLLAGDPMPTHRAALLRRPGTDNTKNGEVRPCHIIEQIGQQYDISEFAELLEMYGDGDQPQLTSKAKGNGHDNAQGDLIKQPVDIDARLAAMKWEGVGDSSIHWTQTHAMAAMLAQGISLKEATAVVLEATRRCVAGDPKAANWDWKKEEDDIAFNGMGLINKDHTLADRLPDGLREKFEELARAGKRPNISRNEYGVFVRKGPEKASERDADAATQGSNAKPRVLTLNWFKPFDVAKHPSRAWLYGRHFQRQTVSLTAGPGGMGKSSLDLVEGISMATCRNLLGDQPEERLRVWFHNGDDPLDETMRRVAAICQHYGIPQEELQGHLCITSGNEFPLRVARGWTSLEIDTGLVQQISDAIGEKAIDLVIFDPLVTMHSVSEMDTGKMDAVIRLFAGIADEHSAAIEVAHHVRKPAPGSTGDYDVHDIRGVQAITDAVRAARILNRMNTKDAEAAGCDESQRLLRFRVDRAKGNYSPAQAATWRQLVNVEIANGDAVGVVAPWEFPGQGQLTPERASADRKADDVFLHLLDRFNARGITVGVKVGPNYAPKLFADEREARGAKVPKAVLKAAMNRLLDAGRIKLESAGRSDRSTQWLILCQEP